MKSFYVYILSVQGLPFYVGKGCGNRDQAHELEARNTLIDITHYYNSGKILVIREAVAKGNQIGIERVFTTTNNRDALDFEKATIRSIGCQFDKTGPLTNLTYGGEGGGGHRLSLETRAKMSAAQRGKSLSKEHRIKLSLSHKGIQQSAAANDKRSKSFRKFVEENPGHFKQFVTVSRRQKNSNAMCQWWAHAKESGYKRPPISELTRQRLRMGSLGRKRSVATRIKAGVSLKAAWKLRRLAGLAKGVWHHTEEAKHRIGVGALLNHAQRRADGTAALLGNKISIGKLAASQRKRALGLPTRKPWSDLQREKFIASINKKKESGWKPGPKRAMNMSNANPDVSNAVASSHAE